jgi:hypothetical protein
MYHHKVMN